MVAEAVEIDVGIRPLGKRILIKPVAIEETVTKGGVHLPQLGPIHHYKADVIRVGPDVTTVNPGDLIVHTIARGEPVEHHQEMFMILEEEDVLAVLDR